MPDELFWAWVAAFWEGEGSLSVYANRGRGNVTQLRIAQKNPAPLYLIRERFGRGYVYGPYNRKRKGSIYQFTISNRDDILAFYSLISNHLKFRQGEWTQKLPALTAKRSKKFKGQHSWTSADVDYLLRNRGRIPYSQIAQAVGHSLSSVCAKAWQLGLSKPRMLDQ